MAKTPEAKVKAKVVDVLKSYGAYFFYPVTGGYGRSGVPDIVCCWKGRFMGIECKANGGVITALQMKNLNDIVTQKGISLVIDDTGVGVFVILMNEWDNNGLPPHGYIADLINQDGTKPTK